MRIAETVYTYSIDRSDGPYAGECLSVHVIDAPDATVQFGAGDEHTANSVADITTSHDVDVIISEHGDPDHYRGIPHLRERSNVEVATPRDDTAVLVDAGITVDHGLDPGRVYWDIETIAVPGHSPGNMSFVYRDILIAGDSVIGSDFGRAADEDWTGDLAVLGPESHHDVEMARQNVSRLAEYEFDTVLVTHGSNVLTKGKHHLQILIDDLGVAKSVDR